MPDQRSIEITSGNAAKIALDATLAVLGPEPEPETLLSLYSDFHPKFTQLLLDNQAVFIVQNEPPGTVVAPQAAPQAPVAPPAAVQPFPAAQPQPGGQPFQAAAPAALPGVQSDPADQLWQMFFNDIQTNQLSANWFDNRVGKQNPKSPDFKHKTFKRNPSDKYTAGLYLDDKKNPAWVTAQLRQLGLVA